MKLDSYEAEEYLEDYDENSDYLKMDDLERLIELKKILVKYNENFKYDLNSGYEKIWVADYPFDGMTQEDIDELLESGFFFDVEYGDIAMYA